MNVGKANAQDEQGVPRPGGVGSREDGQGNNKGEHPDLADEDNEEAVINPALAEPSPEDELDKAEHGSRDGEEVGVEGVETERAEDQSQVGGDGVGGESPGESEEVDGPEVVIAHSFPEELEVEALAVVHVAFGPVVAEDAVDHDDFFAGKPFVFASEVGGGLGGWGREVKPGGDADESRENDNEGLGTY
jgi:hypothetical protein